MLNITKKIIQLIVVRSEWKIMLENNSASDNEEEEEQDLYVVGDESQVEEKKKEVKEKKSKEKATIKAKPPKKAKKTVKKIEKIVEKHPKAVEKAAEEKPIKFKKVIRRRIVVDYWKTGLHGKKIGIRQKDQQRARSRQFSKDMDLYGAVKIGTEDAGNVGYRETEMADVKEGRLKRLVIRYFSEKENWVASLEEDTIKGLMRTLMHGQPLPAFNIFQTGNENFFTLETLRKLPGMTVRMALPIMLDAESNKIDFFIFEKKRIAIGSDWKVYRPAQKEVLVAEFDSKKLNIGGKVNIDVYDAELLENKFFINMLILFGGLLKFLDAVNNALKDAAKKYFSKELSFTPGKQERELLLNPRRFAR